MPQVDNNNSHNSSNNLSDLLKFAILKTVWTFHLSSKPILNWQWQLRCRMVLVWVGFLKCKQCLSRWVFLLLAGLATSSSSNSRRFLQA